MTNANTKPFFGKMLSKGHERSTTNCDKRQERKDTQNSTQEKRRQQEITKVEKEKIKKFEGIFLNKDQ